MNVDNLGANMLRRMEKKDMSVRKLSCLSEVGYNTIGLWIRGKSSPTLDKLVKVANVLGVTVNDLLED